MRVYIAGNIITYYFPYQDIANATNRDPYGETLTQQRLLRDINVLEGVDEKWLNEKWKLLNSHLVVGTGTIGNKQD